MLELLLDLLRECLWVAVAIVSFLAPRSTGFRPPGSRRLTAGFLLIAVEGWMHTANTFAGTPREAALLVGIAGVALILWGAALVLHWLRQVDHASRAALTRFARSSDG